MPSRIAFANIRPSFLNTFDIRRARHNPNPLTPAWQITRQDEAKPILNGLHQWMQATLARTGRKEPLADAIRYSLTLWTALSRYLDDGRLEIDNGPAERALRGVALGRKNYLFAGSDDGGERAAGIYSLLETAKLNGIEPEAYLRQVLTVIAEHAINQIQRLLPWQLKPTTDA